MRVITRILLIAIFVAVPALLGVGCDNYEDESLVSDYCEYGSRSELQYKTCKDHVTAEQVRARNTPAARWAKRGGYCGDDAGPFCFDREQAELDDWCKGEIENIAPPSPAECEHKYQELSDRRSSAGWGRLPGY